MYSNRFGKSVWGMGIAKFLILGAMISTVLFSAAKSRAQDCTELGGYSCTYEIEKTDLQKVPPFFKFQTRISQAKLPVGDVIFDKIFVNVKRGEASLCQETFSQVPVRDSVLNLELGRTMDCELGTIIANNDDLKFQVCIGNQENCLKPVSLSSVPFAVKSSYANLASKADKANEAVQCHYAHRVTADRELFTSQKIGMGFYDFYTPSPSEIDNLVDLYDETAMSTDYYTGGYVQWMQLDPTNTNLHICGQFPDSVNNQPVPLDELVFHAVKTQAFGRMVVKGDPSYTREGDQGTFDQRRALFVEKGMTVGGVAYFNDDVIMSNADSQARVFQYAESHTLIGDGVSNFRNTVNVGQTALTSDDESQYDSTVVAKRLMNVYHWSKVYGNSQYYANTNHYANATFEGVNKQVKIEDQTVLDVDGYSYFNQDSTFNADVYFNGPNTVTVAEDNHLVVNGISDFYATANFHGSPGTSDAIYAERTGGGYAVWGVGRTGFAAMRADNSNGGSGIEIHTSTGYGVNALSNESTAVYGASYGEDQNAIVGNAGSGSGIFGHSDSGYGVYGEGEYGGYFTGDSGAIRAETETGQGIFVNSATGQGILSIAGGTAPAISGIVWGQANAITATSGGGAGILASGSTFGIEASGETGGSFRGGSIGVNAEVENGTAISARAETGIAISAYSYEGQGISSFINGNNGGAAIQAISWGLAAGISATSAGNGISATGDVGGYFDGDTYGVNVVSQLGPAGRFRAGNGVYETVPTNATDYRAPLNIGTIANQYNGVNDGDLWIEYVGSVTRLCVRTGNTRRFIQLN